MKSMTGFGKGNVSNEAYHIEIEVKSVNNRYLDIQFRMPREYNAHEMTFRQLIKENIGRGRIECAINVSKEAKDSKELAVNWSLLDSLVSTIEEAQKERYQHHAIDFSQVIQGLALQKDFFEIVENQEEDEQLVRYLVEGLKKAIDHLNQNREKEGNQIQQVMGTYLEDFKGYVQTVQQMTTTYEQDYQKRIDTKMQALLGDQVDETRLLTEVALLIERGDIHEELDRLVIHSNQMNKLLQQKEAVGRELDFLIQEMNREVNTIGSKSTAIAIKNAVVQMKTILEKIREQVQNVE